MAGLAGQRGAWRGLARSVGAGMAGTARSGKARHGRVWLGRQGGARQGMVWLGKAGRARLAAAGPGVVRQG